VQWYIVPMCAALWSSSASDVLGSSAYAMVAFMDNHCMLQVGAHILYRILGIAPLHI
jgi:predicted NAD/FAD-binding protein